MIIAAGVTIVDSDFHPLDFDLRIRDTIIVAPCGPGGDRPDFDAQPVVIGDGVRIGYNATILKGVQIGEKAVVGPGAVVTRSVAPGAFVMGNPAREVDPEAEGQP